jgi:cytoskeletal protein CcmA (bactofilin family)
MQKKIIQINKNPVYEVGMISTVFNKDTELYGDLTFMKSLQINGYFEGDINSTGFLVIGEGAIVKANIKAKTVLLKGVVHGNIEANERIEIFTNGKLFGNVKTTRLKIHDGVIFEGNCEMTKDTGILKKSNDALNEVKV